MRRSTSGFTLIELLIVVAIIAILAAIAVPNFLEAQTRAKVSRVRADLRSLATALEAYIVDWNAYPPCNTFSLAGAKSTATVPQGATLERLSTPIAYITSAFLNDPFTTDKVISFSTPAAIPGAMPFIETDPGPQAMALLYTSWDNIGRTIVPTDSAAFTDGYRAARTWVTFSGGPDRAKIALGGVLANFTADQTQLIIYDATNGTISFGDIYRVGGQPGGDLTAPSQPYGGGFGTGIQRSVR